jgi:protein ImuA
VLWVQDGAALRLTGRPYRPGLPAGLRRRVIHVLARKPEDALFALEEGLRCRELACVIGEIAGNPRALDFTASRRLSLVAEKHGVPLFLVRLDAARDLSSARMRWQVTAAPSPPPCWNAAAPGMPAWHAELFRARAHPPGKWILHASFDAASGVALDGLRDGLSASGLASSSGRPEEIQDNPTPVRPEEGLDAEHCRRQNPQAEGPSRRTAQLAS